MHRTWANTSALHTSGMPSSPRSTGFSVSCAAWAWKLVERDRGSRSNHSFRLLGNVLL
jgi:hypothetical protein